MNTIAALTDKIIQGYRIRRGDDLSIFLEAPLEELQQGAGALQRHFCGNHIDFCTIINGRSGRCGEDCKYCAQSACHHTGCEEYGFLAKEEILANAKVNQDAGANRFAIVTSGRALTGADFEKALDTYRTMKQTLHIDLCASHGLLTPEQLHRLHETGVTSYRKYRDVANNIHLHDHTYDPHRTIRLALERRGSACVCSGSIIGMGNPGKTAWTWPSAWPNWASSPFPSTPSCPFPARPWNIGRSSMAAMSCGPSPSSASSILKPTSAWAADLAYSCPENRALALLPRRVGLDYGQHADHVGLDHRQRAWPCSAPMGLDE